LDGATASLTAVTADLAAETTDLAAEPMADATVDVVLGFGGKEGRIVEPLELDGRIESQKCSRFFPNKDGFHESERLESAG